MLNGTSDDERDTAGSSGTFSLCALPPPKNLPRICSALDMTDGDQCVDCDEKVVVSDEGEDSV